MKKSLKWSQWILGLSLLGVVTDVRGVNIYLRSGTTTCIYTASTTQTLQKTAGTNQAGIAFSAKTNTFSFYSAPLTSSTYLSPSRATTGRIGVQNNGNADFQFQAGETLYDYDPATGNQDQIVSGSASAWVTESKNGKTGKVSLPSKSVGGSGYTIPASHVLKADIKVVVNLGADIDGALIYNASSGNGKSLVQFPKTGFNWPFGSFAAAADATIIAPSSVTRNSTGNTASVRDAGAGAAYAWTITNGIITAGQYTREITWTAGSAGTVGLGVTIVNGCSSSGSASVISLTVKTNQIITFDLIPAHFYGDAAFTLNATASSGLPVTFAVAFGPATVSGNTLTLTGAGTVIVDATQAGNADFNPAITEQSFTVNPKALTVSGISASNKVYDGTTDAAVNTDSAALIGVLAGDAVILDTTLVSGDFADRAVGSDKTVNISGLDIIGTDESKYTLIDPTATADITMAGLIVSGITANEKVYDGTMTATLNTISTALVGVISNDVVTLDTGSAAATFANKNAGPAKTVTISGLALSGADAGNYTLTQPAATADITARTLTVGAMAANKVYDGTTGAAVTLLDNRIPGDTLITSYTSAGFSDKNVGTGKVVSVSGITVSGVDAGNYSYNASAGATANITPAALTITAAANSKTYDGNTSASATPKVSGLIGSDAATGLAETYDTKDVGAGKTLNVSAYTVNDGNGGSNYSVSTAASTAGVITPAALSIQADNKSKFCGQPNPDLTATCSGFVNGENAGVLTSPIVLSTTATASSPVGEYPITASGAAAANYAFSYVDGKLRIGSLPQLDGQSARINGNTRFIISWNTVSGHSYQLEYTDDLGVGWQPLGTPVAGTDAMVYLTNNVNGAARRFFRLGVQ